MSLAKSGLAKCGHGHKEVGGEKYPNNMEGAVMEVPRDEGSGCGIVINAVDKGVWFKACKIALLLHKCFCGVGREPKVVKNASNADRTAEGWDTGLWWRGHNRNKREEERYTNSGR